MKKLIISIGIALVLLLSSLTAAVPAPVYADDGANNYEPFWFGGFVSFEGAGLWFIAPDFVFLDWYTISQNELTWYNRATAWATPSAQMCSTTQIGVAVSEEVVNVVYLSVWSYYYSGDSSSSYLYVKDIHVSGGS